MLNYIYDPAQILAAQTAFDSRLRSTALMMNVHVGYQGGSVQMDVGWQPSLDIWAGSRQLHNRYWNAFGIGQPRTHNSNSIVCEINFPLTGMNRQIQGVLAKDSNGTVWVCHRGGIGGGKKGVGSNLFWQQFPGKWVSVSGDRVASIGAITSPDFMVELLKFVKFVQEIKPDGKKTAISA